jgi:hypothetical protein
MSFVIYSVYGYVRFLQMKKLLQDVYYSSRLKLRNETFVPNTIKSFGYITENSSYFFAIIMGFTKCVLYRNKKVMGSF